MKRFWTLFILACPLAANAHHVVSEYGIAWVEPVTVVEVDVQAARFRLGNHAGSWQLAAPSIEYRFLPWLSAGARVPVAHVRFDDGKIATGLGDVEVTGKGRLYATEHGGFILSGGIGLEIPTGNDEQGLGGGHFELAPFLSFSSSPVERLIVFGLFSDRLSMGGHHHEEGNELHGSVIAPHQEHELFLRAGIAYAVGLAYISFGLDAVYALAHDPGVGPLVGRSEVGFLPKEDTRVALGFDYPLAGEQRFDWRGRLGVSWKF